MTDLSPEVAAPGVYHDYGPATAHLPVKRCANCAFWAGPQQLGCQAAGECRARAPSPGTGVLPVRHPRLFPVTVAADFCGAHLFRADFLREWAARRKEATP